ncbi:mRNA decay activator protein ZFP36L2-like [Senna tora]|uniref:mRNA decay activator protein ZFP36L2-like n=1 Tax=Senna tora TaxID=362788 RepID=A0A834XEQ2_9FABA|nr:mRNA decay activator protein ZFP36L2-like [Senna tora]
MEKSRGNSKIKIPKVKASNENTSPMKVEMEDQLLIGRGRYHQSMTLSPSFQSFAENFDISSPLVRYSRTGSPISGKVSSSGESYTSPTFGSSKYRSAIVQQYNSNSSGNSSFGSRGRLSISPLSSIENLEMMPPPLYGTPVKDDEEVLVMDDIQVRPTSGGKSGRSSSSSSSSSGEEQRPIRHSRMHRSEVQASKSSSSIGPCPYGPRGRTPHQFQATVGSEDAVTTSQPASPVKLERDHALASSSNNIDWSPLDDNIEVGLPHGSTDNPPSREEVDAYINGILYKPPTKKRMKAFVELCSE